MSASSHTLSVLEAGAALRDGAMTSVGLTTDALNRIERFDEGLHAFVTVLRERALLAAERADREFAQGLDRGPLHGIPYALKDIYDVVGVPTTCNSKLRLDHLPAADSEVERRLREGGAVLLGKLNTHEFAIGGPGFDLPFPPARNPWNPDHFTGGSSSGSGVAVAAGFVRLAMGSDTGGSIRSPSCHCGVVGLKPTYGLVSRRGVFPLSYSLDHCGPMAWSVEDAAIALGVVAGYDPADPSSVERPGENYRRDLGLGVDGLRIAYARDLFADVPGVSSEVIAAIDTAAETFAGLGAQVEQVSLPDFELFKACGRIIMCAEAFAIHERELRTRPRDFGRYTFQRIAPAGGLTSADLMQAFRLRRELTVAVDAILRRYDLILTTCGLSPAPRLDEFPHDWPPPSIAVAVQTVPFNVSGHPALALPAGYSRSGMPLGMQLVGRAFDEATVLRAGAAFEARHGGRSHPMLVERAV
ncbi:MAG: amidase [Lysobacteraceae bacterium]|nr:MAG: amidase [Xanthomonadaceae bacterium]